MVSSQSMTRKKYSEKTQAIYIDDSLVTIILYYIRIFAGNFSPDLKLRYIITFIFFLEFRSFVTV